MRVYEKRPIYRIFKRKRPFKTTKKYSWYTAVGLQKVDGLDTSDYLKEIAKRNIEGDITLDESQKLIESYYEQASEAEKSTEEADKVSIKIAKLLSNTAFTFSVAEYINIHKFLFVDVYDRADEIENIISPKKNGY